MPLKKFPRATLSSQEILAEWDSPETRYLPREVTIRLSKAFADRDVCDELIGIYLQHPLIA
jgi:hypothetical protein